MKRIILLIILVVSLKAYSQSDSIGIYMSTEGSTVRIQPLKCAQVKTKTLGAALTAGIANAKIKSVFNGNTSENKADSNTTFVFYFPSPFPINMAQKYYMFSPVYSPEDFIIAKLKSKKNTRELLVGKFSAFAGSTMGVSEDTLIEMSVKEVRGGVYELTFSQMPDPGEYCFVFTGGYGTSGYLPIFDFKVE